MVELRVRQAGTDDREPAALLLEHFFREEGFDASSWQIREQLSYLLVDADSAVFLAWHDARAVGVATGTTTRGLELGLSAEMEDLYVLPEARQGGVGRALISAVADWCRRLGCTLVAVVVTPEGQAAHDLLGYYQARGFENTGRTLLFYHLDAVGE
jgi:aminoglycoside 6'-N-acetyltransferase I